jgi:hypothetical protein
VAVRAHKGTFFHFVSVGSDRFATRDADRERLCGGVHVMEVQIDDATVITADGAASSGFFDKYALDLLKPASHGLPDAPLAPPSPPPSTA